MWWLLAACAEDPLPRGDGKVAAVEAVVAAVDGVELSLYWPADDVLQVGLQGAGEGEYALGMAETGLGGAGWLGEDCATGLCHLLLDGLQLRSVHPDVGGIGTEGVEAGQSTWFWIELQPSMTFQLLREDGTACWTWGNDPEHYPSCEVLGE
jgi:hypothetical protein